MKIIYMHHAERDINPNALDQASRQADGITNRGIEEASILSEKFKNKKITAIVTSPYLRCMHTAEIINNYHKSPIIEEERFNEKNKEETWPKFLKRNMEALADIVKKYNKDDTVICVTSGVNFSAFVCYFYNIEPTDETPWSQAAAISPINFVVDSSTLD